MPTFDVSLVFYTLREHISTTNSIPGECPHLTCLLCITCFVGVSGQQNWFPGSARIWRPSCVLHALAGHLGVHTLDVSLVFDTLWEDVRTTKLIPWESPSFCIFLAFCSLYENVSTACGILLECLHLTFLFCFKQYGSHQEQKQWFFGSACILRFSVVLHASGGYQHNACDSLGVPALGVSLVLDTLKADIETKNNQSMGLPAFYACLVFCMRGRISAHQIRLPGHARIWRASCVLHAVRGYKNN